VKRKKKNSVTIIIIMCSLVPAICDLCPLCIVSYLAESGFLCHWLGFRSLCCIFVTTELIVFFTVNMFMELTDNFALCSVKMYIFTFC